jgi:hypothetical protein
LAEYTFTDLVGLIVDLIPKKTSAADAKRATSPICATIAVFLVPLVKKNGGRACLTPKGGLRPGPVRDEYIRWYVTLRGAELMEVNPDRTPASIVALALIQAREALMIHGDFD